jgi:hypothetical protein
MPLLQPAALQAALGLASEEAAYQFLGADAGLSQSVTAAAPVNLLSVADVLNDHAAIAALSALRAQTIANAAATEVSAE